MVGVLPTMAAIVVDGKILNHDALKRFYAGRHRRQEIIRAGTFADMVRRAHHEIEPVEVECERGATPLSNSLAQDQPWQADQWQSVKQLKGMVLHLDKQVKEAMAKKKRPPRYQQYKDA